MASKYQARSYNDATLAALEHALRDVWEVLKAHNPDGDWENDTELKTALAKNMMALADAGVIDRHELRSRTLETLSLARPH